LGGALIFGWDNDSGNFFYGGRIGIGLGGGWSVDPNGKRPGADTAKGCGSSTTVGTFGDYGINAYGVQFPIEQFAGGINLQSGKTYSEGPTAGGEASFGPSESFDIGGSFGIEVIGGED